MDALSLAFGVVVGVLVGIAVGAGALAGVAGRARSQLRDAQVESRDAQSVADLLTPMRESLENLRRTAESAGRERASAEAAITTQLTAVQQRYENLETATTRLAGALANGQTRGQWGEMQLEGLLEHAGLVEGVHFRRQDTRASAAAAGEVAGDGALRPDICVLLPGGGEILIDAKFPFDAYWASIATADPVVRDEHLRKHASDVLARARELSGKRYSASLRSPDFVVMFLPLESLLSASLEADGLLLEKTFERRVILATPTTMLALLRTVGFGYQRQLMAENAEEIKAAAAEMLNRLGILAEHLEGMRRGLDQAVRGYNSFVGSFDNHAMRHARRLQELGVDGGRTTRAPHAIDAPLRVVPVTEHRSAGATS